MMLAKFPSYFFKVDSIITPIDAFVNFPLDYYNLLRTISYGDMQSPINAKCGSTCVKQWFFKSELYFFGFVICSSFQFKYLTVTYETLNNFDSSKPYRSSPFVYHERIKQQLCWIQLPMLPYKTAPLGSPDNYLPHTSNILFTLYIL